jgi:hypothetical protein
VEAVWSDGRECSRVKPRYKGQATEWFEMSPRKLTQQGVRDRMREIAKLYSSTPWEDDAPETGKASGDDGGDDSEDDESGSSDDDDYAYGYGM